MIERNLLKTSMIYNKFNIYENYDRNDFTEDFDD